MQLTGIAFVIVALLTNIKPLTARCVYNMGPDKMPYKVDY